MELLSFDYKTKILSHKTTSNIPKPVKDEILIKVAYSGICGTDLHILDVCIFTLCKNLFLYILHV